MRHLVVFLLISSVFLVTASSSQNVHGLSCEMPNMKRYFAESDAVFVGHALSKEYVPSKHNFANGESDAITEFSVTESFKGVSQDRVKISSSEWFWGINFTSGLDYVVFAYDDGDMLIHQLCTPTNLVEFSDLAEIRHVASELSSHTVGQIEWPLKCYSPIGTGLVRIIDSDMNTHPDKRQSLQIQVWSSIDQDVRNLTATETGDDTGVFESTIFFRTTDEASSYRIQVFPGDILYVKYVDTTVPFSDKLEVLDSKTIGQIPPDAFGNNWGNTSLDLNVTYLYDTCMSEFVDRVGRDDPRLKWINIEYFSPLKQFKSGILLDEIWCSDSMILMSKDKKNPACVTQLTAQKLSDRGWFWVLDIDDHKINCDNLDPYQEFQCFNDAYSTCRIATVTPEIYTIEGDPIYTTLTITDDCKIQGVADMRTDRFWGEPEMIITKCDALSTDEYTWSAINCDAQKLPEMQFNFEMQLYPKIMECEENGNTWNREKLECDVS